LRAAWVSASAHGLLDLLGDQVALAAQVVRLGQEGAPPPVDLDRLIDDGRVVALRGRSEAQDVGFVAEPLQADAHGVPSARAGTASSSASSSALSSAAFSAVQPAAARRRSRAKSRSSDARSQPARGPLVRPRNAR